MRWRALLNCLLLGIAIPGQVYGAMSDEPLQTRAIKVEIVSNGGKYQLLRGGKPYTVKGAGLNHT